MGDRDVLLAPAAADTQGRHQVRLPPARLGRLHASNMFVDPDIAAEALGFEHADVDQAIRDTARD